MPVLSATGLTVVLSGDAGPVRVLDGVSLALDPATITDVTGPSGAGKTTLLRAVARLLPGAEGQLELRGVDADAIAPGEWRTRVALLPQRAAIVSGTVRDNLLLPWSLKVRHGHAAPSASALDEALASVGLGVDLDRDASRLSVGQAARVALLRVLLTEPEVLLLDEPDANLDDASAASVAEMTRGFAERGGAVVRVRHQRSDALAARRLRLEHGHLSEVSA